MPSGEMPSGGKSRVYSRSTASKSRMVFWYSRWFKRRTTTRPPLLCACLAACAIVGFSQSSNTRRSASLRAPSSFGGISPRLITARTSCHISAARASCTKSVDNVSSRSFPFCSFGP